MGENFSSDDHQPGDPPKETDPVVEMVSTEIATRSEGPVQEAAAGQGDEKAPQPRTGLIDFLIGLINFREFPRRKRVAFFLNLAVGLLSALAFSFITATQWGESNLNLALDFFVAREASRIAGQPASADEICYIDIDYDTHRRWQEPLVTPRDQVASMLLASARGGARVVLLDILLEHPDPDPAKNEALQRAMAEIATQHPRTRLIFPVRIGWKGDRKRNILDDLIDGHPTRFFRAVPYLSATPDDRVIRHWKLFSRYRPAPASAPAVLWGSPFLAAMLMLGQEPVLASMTAALASREAISRNPWFSIPVPGKGVIQMSLRNTDFYLQRIRFSMIPPRVLEAVPEGNVRPLHPDEIAGLVDDPELAASFFEDRLVIIGNSSPDAGDIHSTPLGSMPGMYVMGNSLQTILSGSQPTPTPWWLDLLIEGGALLAGAFLFVHLPSLLAQVISWVVLLVAGGGLSLWYFQTYGVFLNFVFALIGMEILAVLTEVQEALLGRFVSPEHREEQHEKP
jgi:hypothetical protein